MTQEINQSLLLRLRARGPMSARQLLLREGAPPELVKEVNLLGGFDDDAFGAPAPAPPQNTIKALPAVGGGQGNQNVLDGEIATPTSLRGRAQAQPRPEAADVMAQCYNCHMTATPLWRKDDEGKMICNAYGHSSARPISMKSAVIRKRSRHDSRQGGTFFGRNTLCQSGVSRQASPARDTSPTLAPDSSTSPSPPQLKYYDPYISPLGYLMSNHFLSCLQAA
ncbi:GATA type transcriptional activator [Stygiomarasmius scandens]|uniref:GATA type transcriptional activator n=1 Tax=Marasmiellus scandens TaxID=2682957 RepID=A0ABR1IXP6_9AGAR